VSEIPGADEIWQAHLAELRRMHPGATIIVRRRFGLARPPGVCMVCSGPARAPQRRGPIPKLCTPCGRLRRPRRQRA